ncbi:hypothetical protein O4J56_17835 [Nocardiopsis sp. RSe5-2]|uniref:Uncharacterized protein n=1 Tax=Nocardiopsis endophytica TaxID=3018445 RepID=A0ABT4U7T8_9ACTN|nr:hypothetical protein [Nocardiopsis endophytica]MDA2812509.1 hypothetical protein [Nocardiopsis endophytica]
MSEPLPPEHEALEVLRGRARPTASEVATARRAVEDHVRRLIDSGLPDRALDLVNAANAADPEMTWQREADRGRLMWRDGASARRALEGPVVRIDHGPKETFVRGVDSKDAEVRAELKKLGFRRSWKSRDTWRLRKKTTALDRRTRVSRLSAFLDHLGRDRISEQLHREFGEQAREQDAARARALAAGLEPGVADAVRRAERQGAFRSALERIDSAHAELAEHGLGPRWAAQRAELLETARQTTHDISIRLAQALKEERPQAAMALYEELEVAAPPEDLDQERLNRMLANLVLHGAEVPRPSERRALAEEAASGVGEAAAPAGPGPAEASPAETAAGSGSAPSPAPDAPSPQPASEHTTHPQGGQEHERTEVPPPATPAPSASATIDLSGAQAYDSHQAASKAAWWIAEKGIGAWEQTATAAELADPRELLADDAIELADALKRVREEGAQASLLHTADGYGQVAGASEALARRIGTDRLDLGMVASMAQEHSERLLATAALRAAVEQGEDPAMVDQDMAAAPYTDLREARAAQHSIAAVLGRWEASTSAAQMAGSFSKGEDAARLEKACRQAPRHPMAGLEEGTIEAAQRYRELARAAGQVNLRLEADAGALEHLKVYSAAHAERLGATYMQQVRPQHGRAEQDRHVPRAAERGRGQGFGVG